MDPNATLRALIDAAVGGDADELLKASDELIEWLAGGGFPPDDPRPPEQRWRPA